jgi:hypothetical protein
MAVTKSFSVEFDDALLDLEGWKNPRYEGSKLTGQKINEWNAGDITYGKNPVVENKTTALYIGNTLIGGEDEDESYVHIKRHSYVGINRILIIDPLTDDITLLDSTQEEFEPFHRFVTNDLPTGGAFNIRLLDFSIPNALDAVSKYYVKMNKGWLLKSLKAAYEANAADGKADNGIRLYLDNEDKLQFLYGYNTTNPIEVSAFSPTIVTGSSYIYKNKFTLEYWPPEDLSTHDTITYGNITGVGFLSGSSFFQLNKFLGESTLNYLKSSSLGSTEVHITFFNGSVDYSSLNDERSISTFEVDYYTDTPTAYEFDCWQGPGIPRIQLKQRFKPTTPLVDSANLTHIRFDNNCSNVSTLIRINSSSFEVGNSLPSGSYSPEAENLNYQVSWLDKAHTLIANIPKERYLPNGIGEKGYVIIPEQTDRRVKDNIDYYLQKAGLIEKTVTAKAPRRGR